MNIKLYGKNDWQQLRNHKWGMEHGTWLIIHDMINDTVESADFKARITSDKLQWQKKDDNGQLTSEYFTKKIVKYFLDMFVMA